MLDETAVHHRNWPGHDAVAAPPLHPLCLRFRMEIARGRPSRFLLFGEQGWSASCSPGCHFGGQCDAGRPGCVLLEEQYSYAPGPLHLCTTYIAPTSRRLLFVCFLFLFVIILPIPIISLFSFSSCSLSVVPPSKSFVSFDNIQLVYTTHRISFTCYIIDCVLNRYFQFSSTISQPTSLEPIDFLRQHEGHIRRSRRGCRCRPGFCYRKLLQGGFALLQ